MPKLSIVRYRNIIFNTVIIGSYVMLFSIILLDKFKSAQYWLYTSDLFTYDTMLQETLKGFFGMEYTYGNLFGDHASLFLVFFLPVKWIVGKQMVFFLLMITPVLYLLAGLFLLYYLKKIGANGYFYFFSGILFAFQLYVFSGNYEGHYGYHIDTGSGYLFLITALALILKYQYKFVNSFINTVFLFSFIYLILIKEEMALLAFVFFGIIFLFERKKKLLVLAGISLLIFFIEILFVHLFKTNFNRGNELILSNFLSTISDKGIGYYFISPDLKGFWLPFILLVSVFISLCLYNKINGIAFALFITALIKISFSFSIDDFELNTWHSFPALVMFTGSILIQATEKKKGGFYLPEILLGFLFIFFMQRFVTYDLRYKKSAQGCIKANSHYKSAVISDLNKIKKLIPKEQVVGLNGFLAFDFRDGYRYSFYPRGVEGSPGSIADFVLIDKEIPGKTPITGLGPQPGSCVVNEFNKIMENESYILYKRDPSKAMAFGIDRISFIRYFGKESIGPR